MLLAVGKLLFSLESWLAVKQAFFIHVNSEFVTFPINCCFVNMLHKPNSGTFEFGFSFFSPETNSSPI